MILLKPKSTNKQFFRVYVVYLGTEKKEYYPKKKDNLGKTLKDEKGQAIREEKSSGYSYTFVTFDLQKVTIVLNKNIDFNIFDTFLIEGNGYFIKDSNFIFLDENIKLSIDDEIKKFKESLILKNEK